MKMTVMTSVATNPHFSLDMGALENPAPNKPLGVHFSVDLPHTDLRESWEGLLHVNKCSMAEFLNWMENQWQAFHQGKKLGKFYWHGVPIQAEARGPAHQRTLWLKLESRELLKIAKLNHEGDPNQWPDWLMPLERVAEMTNRTLIHPVVMRLPSWL